MKPTLLDIVQEVLNDLDSDEVNSINDTTESLQVATICKAVFRDMLSNRNWPHTRKAIEIVPYSNSSYPTHMRIQDEIKELSFLNYNTAKLDETRKRYTPISWIEQDDFLRRANSLNTDNTNVDVIIDPSGIEVAVRNDTPPKFFTSFNDDTLVFDSYDKEAGDTLQASKVQAYAYTMPLFEVFDDFIPDLPSEAFAGYIAECKSQSFVKLKQQVSEKDEQTARKQQAWLARKDWRVHGGIQFPNYGRKIRKTYTTYGRGYGCNPFDNSPSKNQV